MGSSYIGAFWGDRRESAVDCGARLARCVSALGNVDPVLGSWFRTAATKAAANIPIPLDPVGATELLARGRNRGDADGKVIEELGFSFSAWNRAHPSVGMDGAVGAYPNVSGLLNRFFLSISAPEDGAAALYVPGAAVAILQAIVKAWEPAWATWATSDLNEAQSRSSREPVIGWQTYLRGAPVPVIPRGTARTFRDGVLIQATPEFVDTDNETVVAIHQSLRQSGLIQPIP